jgi:hypothetical protein
MEWEDTMRNAPSTLATRSARSIAFVAAACALVGTASADETDGGKRNLNQIDYAMYFMSDVRDEPGCAMAVEGGRLVTAPPFTNPAMSCPDMFAWKLFTVAVLDRFWEDWADETQNWPAEPYRLCGAGEEPSAVHCCKPGDPGNDKTHCPVFPGVPLRALEAPAPRPLRTSIRSHLFGPHEGAGDEGLLIEALAAPVLKSAAERAAMRPCRELPLPADPESIGRVIRQTNGELTLRNRTFHDFLFRNDLYHADGVIAVFDRNAKNLYTNAPYRRASRPAADDKPTDLSEIVFPSDAVMLKSNWLNAELMAAIGEQYGWDWADPAHPYIQKEMIQTLTDQDGNQYDCSGTHNLLAFHISSKDIPNWVWATFEHVRLPGRCDFTGCNDSWGFFSSDRDLPADAARNYLEPNTKDDDLPQGADSVVFDRDQLYAAEAIRPPLAAVLDALGIGVEPARADRPRPGDRAWRSYRLKGTQVEFVDSMGRPTFLGHSVTEAGFVNGSSCMSCHSRAGSDTDGTFHPGQPGRGTFPLSVFQNELSDFGYGRSAHGFHRSNQPPSLEVLQTDFVWGFLFARPTVK